MSIIIIRYYYYSIEKKQFSLNFTKFVLNKINSVTDYLKINFITKFQFNGYRTKVNANLLF